MPNTRRATAADVPFLEDVFLRAMRVHITATRGFWNQPEERKQFHQQLQLEHTRVVERGNAPVGFSTIIPRGEDVELHTICMAPEYQGQGLGTAIIRQIVTDAQEQGREVFLSVLKPNTAARRLYERLGFTVTAETAHHYQMRMAASRRGITGVVRARK
jgi:ribosomal protein S18 acetylase RimI-like enzyme